jgi:hypothetical protein
MMLVLPVGSEMVSKSVLNHIQSEGSDIQRKVVSTRIVSTPAFRSAHREAAHSY